jgi:hypothetical protein
MICCYLIEELHCSVSDALRWFEEARPAGIKYVYFPLRNPICVCEEIMYKFFPSFKTPAFQR